MKSLILLQITSPWHWRSSWALLRRSHFGPGHRLPGTHCVLTQFLTIHANPRTATWALTWALKRGWTSPNKWHVPASRNLCGVQEQFSDSCAVSLYSLWCKNMGQLCRSLKKGGREFLGADVLAGKRVIHWLLLCCVTAGPGGLLPSLEVTMCLVPKALDQPQDGIVPAGQSVL